jgi:acyl carrier protein
MTNRLEDITAIICRVGKLPGIAASEDFYAAGFSSISALELLIELESACAVTIPDEQFIVSRTPEALHTLIAQLQQEQPV